MAGLTSEQVIAAAAIVERCPTLVAIEDAIDALASSFSGFERESLLLKVAAVAQLLGGPSHTVVSIADHAAAVLSVRPWGPDTVERLAALPDGPSSHRRISFASRFAHFFLDSRRFPAVDGHLIRGLAATAPPRLPLTAPYAAIAERIEQLRTGITPPPALRTVQHALGLVGQALVLQSPTRGFAAGIHDEVRAALSDAALREALLGAHRD